MGVTHATHSSRTTGAAGAKKSEAAKTGRHAALHASQCKGDKASVVGRESAVRAPASPTAIEQAVPPRHPCPDPFLPHPSFAFTHWLLQGRRDRRCREMGQQVRRRDWLEGGRVGQRRSGYSSATGVRVLDAHGLQDRSDEVAQFPQAVCVSSAASASLPLTLESALAVSRLGFEALVGAKARGIRNSPGAARNL
eukprot:3120456-Pleurochrysis_carterae.AAC.1